MNTANLLQARSAVRHGGFSLIELMVVILIASFLVLGMTLLTSNTETTYNNQTQLAQFQDKQRFALMVIGNTIQSAGYYSDSINQTTAAVFPTMTSPPAGVAYTAAGQSVSGTSALTAGGADTLSIRYQTNGGDTIINCQGGSNTNPPGTSVTYENVLTVDASKKALTCAVGVNGGAPGVAMPLIDGVANMKILYGVDTAGVGSVSQYMTAANVTNWTRVLSVQVQLTFLNPYTPTDASKNVVVTNLFRVM